MFYLPWIFLLYLLDLPWCFIYSSFTLPDSGHRNFLLKLVKLSSTFLSCYHRTTSLFVWNRTRNISPIFLFQAYDKTRRNTPPSVFSQSYNKTRRNTPPSVFSQSYNKTRQNTPASVLFRSYNKTTRNTPQSYGKIRPNTMPCVLFSLIIKQDETHRLASLSLTENCGLHIRSGFSAAPDK